MGYNLAKYRGKTMFRTMLDGVPVWCETLDELREVVSANAGRVTDVVEETVPDETRPKKKRNFKRNPGLGTKWLWSFAKWYAPKVNKTKNDARTALVQLKKADEAEFNKLAQEFAKAEKTTPQPPSKQAAPVTTPHAKRKRRAKAKA